MTVHIVIREHQNEHGYIDTSIAGVFCEERTAKEREATELQRAREEGLVVEDAESDLDWQVSWKIEEYEVS